MGLDQCTFHARPARFHAVVLSVGLARALIVSLLFLGNGLAGCSSDDTVDPEEDASGSGPAAGLTTSPTERERLLRQGGLKECEGCIPLDKAPSQPVPAPPEPVSIPFPQEGDRARVQGSANEWGRTPDWIPDDGVAHYDLSLQVARGDGDARFLFKPNGHVQPDPKTRVTVDQVGVDVSLTSRMVQGGEQTGPVRVHGPLQNEEDRRAETRIRPDLETLFWLGAHVWGRDLHPDDRFSTRWASEDPDGAMIHFEYRVQRADPDGIRLYGAYRPFGERAHITHEASPQVIHAHAEVILTYIDDRGAEALWGLLFRNDSPYPILVRSDADVNGPRQPDAVPAMAFDQEIGLEERGLDPLGWSPSVLRSPPTARDDTQVFHLGERIAPRPLDDLVDYPLRTALSDLDLLEDSYRAFVQRHADRALVYAEYAAHPLTVGVRHEWYVVFTDRHEEAHAWTATRIGTSEDDPLVPERQEKATAQWVEAITLLSHPHPPTGPLGIGDALTDAFADIGIDRVDRLYYRLEPSGATGLGGTLTGVTDRLPLSADIGPVTSEDDPQPLGFFSLDLGAQRLRAGGPFVPYDGPGDDTT